MQNLMRLAGTKRGFPFSKTTSKLYNFSVGICKCVLNMAAISRDKIPAIGLTVIYEPEGEANLE